MDLLTHYRGQRFIWDTDKAASNFGKHHVSFEQACEIFFDPYFLIEDASTEDEAREAAIGATSDGMRMLWVVHLVREGETIRIISARHAAAHERKLYEDDY